MPAYNHERFVAQAIESVLAQKTAFRYRLLVGDDCSTDGTQAIIRSYAERHPDRIEFMFSPVNIGALHRNRVALQLLRRATAKYVTVLEGDDYWTSPDKLQKQVDFLERHPECSLCFHNAEMFYDDGSRPSSYLRPPDQKEISTLEDVATGMVPIPCTVLFRNNLLGELPDCFYQVRNADWMLFLLLAEHGHIGYINEVMAAYRMHAGGNWAGLNKRKQAKELVKTYKIIDARLNYKYSQAIAKKIREIRDELSSHSEQYAHACLGRYHALVRAGQLSQALPLVLEALRSSPRQVLRPRGLAAICKNAILGALLRGKSSESL
jgi:glycosyltransferase involved in cell wall biosynthesis